LVNVTVCGAVEAPTASLPNDTLMADSNTTGGLKPIPLSMMLCGELSALSVSVTADASVPAAVGANARVMVHVPPAATLVPQVFEDTNEEAFVPVNCMLAMVSGPRPVLVNVTVCVKLVVPMA